MIPKGIPEEKIIWKDGGIISRLNTLESGGIVSGAIPGGASSAVSSPPTPTNLAVVSEEIVYDDRGCAMVELVISWDGNADTFEVAFIRTGA